LVVFLMPGNVSSAEEHGGAAGPTSCRGIRRILSAQRALPLVIVEDLTETAREEARLVEGVIISSPTNSLRSLPL